ncbi:class I SAM-dependent methyltransferase [Streptomyces sp. WMMC500]|uniref:class I SAM-dependent methyltransferase n=1 Tax=Streptomyces sp. WMMC500 TaxID=3015154 RepID=UPI00248CCCF2|nr:class I SAM-dependent methyltransferase [Streptomyces sp. WMMC500]WBB61091.1 class I SAM-dependent methyltransferase [Streptomyces sp. WMMC500]
MTDDERERLRATFTEAPELYDRARPRYPRAMYDDLAVAAPAGLGPGCRVLEIGCGTGQATVPLAERGCRVTAVELGADMARVARRNLAGFPDVDVENAAFEQWPLPPEPFDVVLAATAFAWVDPAVRAPKSADALRPGGVLATIRTHHVAGGSEEFFAEAQGCYERFDPATPPGLRLRPASAVPEDRDDLRGEKRFAAPVFHRYEWELPYSTAEYLDLLRTYSGHRLLPAPARDALLACLAGLIDGRHGGRIVKRYLTELRIARRVG